MKRATEYARRIRRLYARLKRRYGTPKPADLTDPTDQLLLGILHQGTTVARARKVLSRIRSNMVDLNELRVSNPPDLVEMMGSGFPRAADKARQLVHALNQVYKRYHSPSLDHLKDRDRPEARRILEALKGVDPCAIAGVVLFSLGGRAIPVDENMAAVLRAEGLVDPHAEVGEVRRFLERITPAAEAYAFTTLLRRYSEERIGRARVRPPSDQVALAPVGVERTGGRVKACPRSVRKGKTSAPAGRTRPLRRSSPRRRPEHVSIRRPAKAAAKVKGKAPGKRSIRRTRR